MADVSADNVQGPKQLSARPPISPPDRYFDPMGVIHTIVPSGWALDPFKSRIDRIVLGNWFDPTQFIQVGIERTVAPPSRSESEWLKASARYHDVVQSDLEVFPVNERLAYIVRKRYPDGADYLLARRRGIRVDLILEHYDPSRDSSVAGERLLQDFLIATSVPADSSIPRLPRYHEFQSEFDRALDLADSADAQARDAYSPDSETALAFASAFHLARSALLHGIMTASPDLWAARQVVVTLRFLGTLSGLPLLRDAVQSCDRTLQLLSVIPEAEDAVELRSQLNGLRQGIEETLQRLTKSSWKAGSHLLTLLSTAELCLNVAIQSDKADQLSKSSFYGGLAAADFGSLLLGIRTARLRNQHLHSNRTVDTEFTLSGETMEARVVVSLHTALELWWQAATKMQATTLSLNRADYMISTARLLRANNRSALTSRILAQSLLARTHAALAFVSDSGSLATATTLLSEAQTLASDFNDDAFSANLSLLQARTQLLRGDKDGIGRILDNGLVAARRAHEDVLVAALLNIRATLAVEAGDPMSALGDISHAVGVGDAVGLSTHLLTLANAQLASGNRESAILTIARALMVSVADNPTGQDTVNTLLGAARIVGDADPGTALELARTAKTVVDARWTEIDSTDDRIAFADAGVQLAATADLFAALIQRDLVMEALEIADASRARVLNHILGRTLEATRRAPENVLERESSAQPPLPDSLNDPKDRLKTIAVYVRSIADATLEFAGYPPVPNAQRIVEIVTASNQPALYLQPAENRLYLLLVLPGPGFIYGHSPAELEIVLERLTRVQGELRIQGAARSPESPATVTPANIAVLEHVLARLTSSILPAPIEDFLRNGFGRMRLDGLTIVPYRDMTLVPYSLLRLADGTYLGDRLALSVTPSIATLDLIQRRPQASWERALIIGDPRTDDDLGLRPLPAASIEALEISRMLGRVIGAEATALRRDRDATENEFWLRSDGASVLHLACHAEMRVPGADSCLFLARGPKQDGLLTAREVSGLKLNGGLVYLSACRTGVGRPTPDGVIGLGRSFLEGGASTVIMTLTRVADELASALAIHFYRHWLPLSADQPSLSVSTAFRNALRDTRADLRSGKITTTNGVTLEDDPAFWGAFVVFGDGHLTFRRPCF